jgi:uncharacterized protein (DUF2062 family)
MEDLMAKAFIRRYLPTPEQIREMKGLGFLRNRLSDPSLWHLNRRSASWAMFWGLFCAFLPVPFQMVPATAIAIVFRINLPLMILLVWITNPLTLLPFMYSGYWLGSHLLDVPMLTWHQLEHLATRALHMSDAPVDAFEVGLLQQLKPFFLGSVVLGLVLGTVGYIAMRYFWRWHVVTAWRKRLEARLAQKSNDISAK